MTLALRLGKTLGELTQSLSVSELRLWMAHDLISPIGDRRGDIQAAMVASAVLNSQGAKVNISDMLINWSPEDDEQQDSNGLEGFLSALAEESEY